MSILTDNEAFQDTKSEIIRILEGVIKQISEESKSYGDLFDVNGNFVGYFQYK
jgi:hypothetical protein